MVHLVRAIFRGGKVAVVSASKHYKGFQESKRKKRFAKAELVKKIVNSNLSQEKKNEEIKEIVNKKKRFFGVTILINKKKRSRDAEAIRRIYQSNLPIDQKHKEIELYRRKHGGNPYDYKGAE